MKIERKQTEPKFEPIVITIESQAEFDALWIGMNHSRVTFENLLPHRANLEHSEFKDALDVVGEIWQRLNTFVKSQTKKCPPNRRA